MLIKRLIETIPNISNYHLDLIINSFINVR